MIVFYHNRLKPKFSLFFTMQNMDMGWFIYVRRIKPKFVTVNYGCRHYEHLSILDEPLFMLCKPNKSLSSFCFSIKTVPENQGKCNEMEFMPAPLTGNLL